MSLTINTGLTTNDGGTVATGSFVQFDVYFPTQAGEYNANISVWRDEAARDSGLRTVNPVEIPRLNFNKTLTDQEFADLTPTTIHVDIQAYLEGYLGAGTVAINPIV
jgi:hypothetical protein